MRKVRLNSVTSPQEKNEAEAKKPKISSLRLRYVYDDGLWASQFFGTVISETPAKSDRNRGSAFRMPVQQDYFICPETVEEHRKWFSAKGYSKGRAEEEARKICRSAFDRYMAYINDKWHFLGIVAEAECECEHGFTRTLKSLGVWGIESDCIESINENTQQELRLLKGELEREGVSLYGFEFLVNKALGQEIEIEYRGER